MTPLSESQLPKQPDVISAWNLLCSSGRPTERYSGTCSELMSCSSLVYLIWMLSSGSCIFDQLWHSLKYTLCRLSSPTQASSVCKCSWSASKATSLLLSADETLLAVVAESKVSVHSMLDLSEGITYPSHTWKVSSGEAISQAGPREMALVMPGSNHPILMSRHAHLALSRGFKALRVHTPLQNHGSC